jgi:hypothetical protein
MGRKTFVVVIAAAAIAWGAVEACGGTSGGSINDGSGSDGDVSSGDANGSGTPDATTPADATLASDAAASDGSSNGNEGGANEGGTSDASLDGASSIDSGVHAVTALEAYLKASNTRSFAYFGGSMAISADGNTLVVSGSEDSSSASGINADGGDTSAINAGAVYVFTRAGTAWSQQAYIKASNARADSYFGCSVAISSDGNTLAVGAYGESSGASGVGADPTDTSAAGAGAVYVFTRNGATWSQQVYIKASTARAGAHFGTSVTMSSDGNTLGAGAIYESSNAKGIGGSEADTSAAGAGAAYVFTRAGVAWSQQAYIKASNTRTNAYFGVVALSGDGNTFAVGSTGEMSNATTIGGDQTDTSYGGAGAIYVFTRAGTAWSQQQYIKAFNTRPQAEFGNSVALSSDGNTMAAGAFQESSSATGVGGDAGDQNGFKSGAAYVFSRAGTAWSQSAYVKASNTRVFGQFGIALTLSPEGDALLVGSPGESSPATGIDGNEADASASNAGAAYLFARAGVWTQIAYLKATNTRANMQLGEAVAVSSHAQTIVIGAQSETSNATGVNGNQNDTSLTNAGSAYVYR